MSACVVRGALLGVTLAEHIDEWILHRGRLGRPLERLALSRAQIDALFIADLLEFHVTELPAGAEPPTPIYRAEPGRPFYRGFPVVEQGNKCHE